VSWRHDDERYPIPGKEADECGGDPEYLCRYEMIHFDSGLQMMNGVTALKFVRTRNSENLEEGTDLARSIRQQKVLLAIRDKIMSTEIIPAQTAQPPSIVEHAMTVEELHQQIQLMQTHMEKNMKDGEHYGVIPGCGDKPTLLKPGAEKLCFIFRLSPSFSVTQSDHPKGHREYQVTCTLTHGPSGIAWAQGVGCCSTMENKYKYRWDSTGRPVPRVYWDNRDKALIGGEAFTTRKVGGDWMIFQRVEHDNPADYYNTCLKMAKKRAQVDAALSATAASDIFTQDIEEMNLGDLQKPAKKPNKKKEQKEPAPGGEVPANW